MSRVLVGRRRPVLKRRPARGRRSIRSNVGCGSGALGSPAMGTQVAGLDERTRASIAAYDEHARAYQESLRRRRPIADIRRFAAMVEDGRRVLDVGCGPANDLRLLRDTGVHPIGTM